MDNSRFLVAAYTVFWLLPFGLIVSIWLRQRRIDREIEALKRRWRGESQRKDAKAQGRKGDGESGSDFRSRCL